jgi:general L-amino acid transport system substrate-binding protein
LRANSALQLSDASICVQQGTTNELNLTDYFRINHIRPKTVTFASLDEALSAYETSRCDAFTTDASGLYSIRLELAKADDHLVLPEFISKEPLGPFVRHGDDQWFDIVKWVHFAMLDAEELNVNRGNVDEPLRSDNPRIKRLLGMKGNFGEHFGLTKDWVYGIVKLVGNYGEVFERNVSEGSPLKIARGLNALWTKGGLQYAPPRSSSSPAWAKGGKRHQVQPGFQITPRRPASPLCGRRQRIRIHYIATFHRDSAATLGDL